MLGQDIPNFQRLPNEENIALIARDSDIVLTRYIKVS